MRCAFTISATTAAQADIDSKVGPRSLDDILHFNTQASSQWDGLRHFPYQNWPEQGDKR
jgi:hypothetical protein